MKNNLGLIKNIALFDLDGTLCDYDGASKRDYDNLKSPDDPPYEILSRDNEPIYIKRRLDLIRSHPGWWESLPELKIGFDVLNVAMELGYIINILTKGPSDINKVMAWTEKVRWAKKHIPKASVTITEDKSLVYGKVLVDDFPGYIEGWLNHRPRGLVIMPYHRWNKNYKHINLIRYDGSNLEEVKDAMAIVMERKPNEELILK